MSSYSSGKARRVAIDLLSQGTDRDHQRKVGASNISNPCTYCLARDMAVMLDSSVEPAPRGKYYMGSVIGTAIHNLLEERAKENPDYLPEVRVVLGEIPGYGVIKSTSDLFIKSLGAVNDWKTTTREKLKWLRMVPDSEPEEYDFSDLVAARYKIKTYLTQGQLYGLGMEKAGYAVKTISLVFIARDAKTEADVWAHTVDYNRKVAEIAFDRAARIWQALEQGKELATFKSHEGCYQCSVEGRV